VADIVTDRDVERALHVFSDLTAPRQDGSTEIGVLIRNNNLYAALVAVAEAKIAETISASDPKLAADKIKWRSRASPEYHKALVLAARAEGELGSARLRLKGAENIIEIWRSQSANNRRGHM
jgi:hypothetical protein